MGFKYFLAAIIICQLFQGITHASEMKNFVEGDDAAQQLSQRVGSDVAYSAQSLESVLERHHVASTPASEEERLLPQPARRSNSFWCSDACMGCMIGHGVLLVIGGLTMLILWLTT